MAPRGNLARGDAALIHHDPKGKIRNVFRRLAKGEEKQVRTKDGRQRQLTEMPLGTQPLQRSRGFWRRS